ncbi:MAG: FAD:protein FMN transferase [Propionibacteriaceae bacterium]
MSHVFYSMGTAISLAGDLPAGATDQVEAVFAELERRYSLYRPESEASQIARRELLLADASEEMRDTYTLAMNWRAQTDGAFTPNRPDGVIDLAGVVKAIAIERAGEALDACGSAHWCLNAGGDILTRTGEGRDPWVIGVVDPDDRSQLLTQFTADDKMRAFATSGITERGEHIWRVGVDDTFVQVSVAAPDIVTADVLATAIVGGGAGMLDKALKVWPLEVIACARTGEYKVTPAFLAA